MSADLPSPELSAGARGSGIPAPDPKAEGQTFHGIPHDQGEQRCQTVGGNAEGKVSTTALVCASESPGSNSAAGADGRSDSEAQDSPNDQAERTGADGNRRS